MELIEITVNGKHRKGLYKCKCGKVKTIRVDHVNSGRTKSCGCACRIHGHAIKGSHTSEYNSWQSMIQRCTNKNSVSYHNYGERGIGICQQWQNSFEQFLLDMGKRPSVDHSLDRINNNGNYEKNNCRWATIKMQSINKRGKPNHSSRYKGVSFSNCIRKFIAQIQVNKKTIYLGSSKDEEFCAKMYNEAAIRYFGNDCFLNNIV